MPLFSAGQRTQLVGRSLVRSLKDTEIESSKSEARHLMSEKDFLTSDPETFFRQDLQDEHDLRPIFSYRKKLKMFKPH